MPCTTWCGASKFDDHGQGWQECAIEGTIRKSKLRIRILWSAETVDQGRDSVRRIQTNDR
jgi:hypothetical protein